MSDEEDRGLAREAAMGDREAQEALARDAPAVPPALASAWSLAVQGMRGWDCPAGWPPRLLRLLATGAMDRNGAAVAVPMAGRRLPWVASASFRGWGDWVGRRADPTDVLGLVLVAPEHDDIVARFRRVDGPGVTDGPWEVRAATWTSMPPDVRDGVLHLVKGLRPGSPVQVPATGGSYVGLVLPAADVAGLSLDA